MVMDVLAIFTSGALIAKVKICNPSMIAASTMLCVGAGLLTTLRPYSTKARWVVFQMVAGLGCGSGTQVPLIAVQNALAPEDISTGLAVILTCGYLGSSLAVSVAQTIFTSQFKSLIGRLLPGISPDLIDNAGATNIDGLIGPKQIETAVSAYNAAVVQVFYASVALSGLSLIGAFGIKWKRMTGDHASG